MRIHRDNIMDSKVGFEVVLRSIARGAEMEL